VVLEPLGVVTLGLASTDAMTSRPSGGRPGNDRNTQGGLLLDEAAYPVWSGSVVARPPATRVAYAFCARDGGLTLLAFGSSDPDDVAFSRARAKVSLRGIGLRFRVDRLDYWDGEGD
jgi:hypothetical protein